MKFLRVISDDYACPAGASATVNYFGYPEEIDTFASAYQEHVEAGLRQSIERGINHIAELKRELLDTQNNYDMEQLKHSIENVNNQLDIDKKRLKTPSKEFYTAWDAYRKGNVRATVNAAFSEYKLVEPATIFAEKELLLDSYSVDIPNVYNYYYDLHWTKAKVNVKWIGYESDRQLYILDDDNQVIGKDKVIRQENFVRCVQYDIFEPLLGDRMPVTTWGHPTIFEINEDEGWMKTRLYLQDAWFADQQSLTDDITLFKTPDFKSLLLEIVGDG